MADTNERKRRVLDSPLFKLIEETWIDYDSRIATFTISEEDVFRYTLWCIEGVKDNTGNRALHETKMRALLFKKLKIKYAAISKPEELNLLADIIIAYTLECLEWAQTADWTSFMSVYEDVIESIDTKNKASILGYKKEINVKVYEMNLCTSFKMWIADHLTNDFFLTEENAEWIDNNITEINSNPGAPGDHHTFEMPPEEWVERYDIKIKTKFIDKTYLIDRIKKLRDLYIEQLKQSKINRTGFLRDNIFWPKSPWLHDPNMFPAEAIRDMFNDTLFRDKTVSDAKKKE